MTIFIFSLFFTFYPSLAYRVIFQQFYTIVLSSVQKSEYVDIWPLKWLLDSVDIWSCFSGNRTNCNGLPEAEFGPNPILCDSGQCVPDSTKCDHYMDCLDGKDEENCGKGPASPDTNCQNWLCLDIDTSTFVFPSVTCLSCFGLWICVWEDKVNLRLKCLECEWFIKSAWVELFQVIDRW